MTTVRHAAQHHLLSQLNKNAVQAGWE